MQGIRPDRRRNGPRHRRKTLSRKMTTEKGFPRIEADWCEGSPSPFLSWTWPPDGYSQFSLCTYTMWCVFHGLYECYWLFYPVFYLQQGCMCVTLLHSSTCVSCITSYYYSFVQYYCTWSHRNGDCPGQVVQAMPPPFVPWNDIGDPDLSVIPPPVDYRCCCCVTFYPMEGINFVFIFISFT